MSETHRLPAVEFDVVGVAAGSALVGGALSLVDPYLASLTAALAALALAGWVAGRPHADGTGRRPLRHAEGFALASLAVGGLFFLAGPSPLLGGRALVLAGSLIPLWVTARSRSPGVP